MFHISAASIELLKWLAVVLMVVDHINKFVLKESVPSMFALGRIAMPLFVFVLGYNLARPAAYESGVYQRVLTRLTCFGVLSIYPHAMMNVLIGGWWPVNIMFTLALAVLIMWLTEKGGVVSVIFAWVAFLLLGAVVEFWWPAVAGCLFVWLYFKKGKPVYLVGFVLSLLALYFVNGNFWALLALPVIVIARAWRWQLPRMKWFFYAFYPLHFILLWLYIRFAS